MLERLLFLQKNLGLCRKNGSICVGLYTYKHLQMQLCISFICLRAWLGWRATLFDSLGVALVAASWDTTELITVNSDNCSQTYSTRDHLGEGRIDFQMLSST